MCCNADDWPDIPALYDDQHSLKLGNEKVPEVRFQNLLIDVEDGK